MKIVFMGTPDFAVPTLTALYEAGHEILAAVSQPDKPKGRHGAPQPTPVKAEAERLGIPVLQPEKARDEAFIEEISSLSPDVIVVTAYGQILKKALLDVPRCGCINVHASLLPRWRGAAPIQWAVIEGDREAGVTTMMMDEGLDTGDMLLTDRLTLAADETGGSLFEKLSAMGGRLIVETLRELEAGTLPRTPQPEAGMTYAKMLKKEMGDLDFGRDAAELERLVRGLSPWPGAYSHIGGKLLKIHRAALVKQADAKLPQDADKNPQPGTLFVSADGALLAACGRDYLQLCEVQLEGKKRMEAETFLRGAGELLKEHPRLEQRCEEKAAADKS